MSKVKVLVVDDSVVFRTQIKAALETSPEIEVVGVANNGKIALQKLAQLSVDVVTLDMEMPEMDGAETIQAIRAQKFPVRVIVFSSQTKRGSERALQALSLGADDILAKPELTDASGSSPAELMARDLVPKVLQFRQTEEKFSPVQFKSTDLQGRKKILVSSFEPSAIVIGSSTGGPQALETVLHSLKAPLKIPIFIVQHMPPVFTTSLARRLSEKSGIPCTEAVEGERVMANKIYVAPGDFHLSLIGNSKNVRTHLEQGPQRNSVRPAVDFLFESAAKIYGAKCLAIILTGMGEDGLQGCRAIKECGGAVIIQSKETCVVFGMPGAVFTSGLQDEIMDLQQLNQTVDHLTTLKQITREA